MEDSVSNKSFSSSSSNAQQQQEQDFVVDLDPSNFTDTIIKNNFVVVNYHMPSVEEKRYSNAFATEYKKASVILRNNDPLIVLAQLDMERKVNVALAKSQIGIWIYPSLLMFINAGKQLHVYYGPHDAQGIANYLRKIATPNPAQPTSLFGDTSETEMIFDSLAKVFKAALRPKFTSEFVLDLVPSNFNETIGKHDFVVVHFYDSGKSKKFAAEYEKAASILSSNDPPIVFAQVDVDNEVNIALEAQFDIKNYPAIRIFRDGGKKVKRLDEVPADAQEFVKCLKGSSAGNVDNTSAQI
ncbi:hypothetical protein ACFE04_024543 [Oxalis oulophora]